MIHMIINDKTCNFIKYSSRGGRNWLPSRKQGAINDRVPCNDFKVYIIRVLESFKLLEFHFENI
jgi:hypothetical protein